MLGVKFGQKDYLLTILKDVEEEVRRSPRLQFNYPWFQDPDIADERMAKRVRLSADEKATLASAISILRGVVLADAESYTAYGRSPPSTTDCRVLAFGQIREAIVVTDDWGMHQLASEFGLTVWHGHELLKKMHTAKLIDNQQVKGIYEALENNNDLPKAWREVRHTAFKKIFGPTPKS